jgi:hypothetical protein
MVSCFCTISYVARGQGLSPNTGKFSLLHISIELNFLPNIEIFYTPHVKKSLLDVKNLTVALTIGISIGRSLALHPTPLLLPPVTATVAEEDRCCHHPLSRTTVRHLRPSGMAVAGYGGALLFGSQSGSLPLPLCSPLLADVQALMIAVVLISPPCSPCLQLHLLHSRAALHC